MIPRAQQYLLKVSMFVVNLVLVQFLAVFVHTNHSSSVSFSITGDDSEVMSPICLLLNLEFGLSVS
jgi:hypothetical protein